MNAMDFELEVEDAFVTNMKLLKFPQSKLTKRHKVVLKREMFRQPNKVGFEVTMYFLFEKLDPRSCENDFRGCWEIFDQKQASQFRRVCAQRIEKIAASEPNLDLPRKAGPILVSPFGRKFYWLICNLSGYVLQKLGPPQQYLHLSTKRDAALLELRTKLNMKKYEIELKKHKEWEEKYTEVVNYNVDIVKELQKEKMELKTNLMKLRKNSSQWKTQQNADETRSKLNRRWEFIHESTTDGHVFEIIPSLLSSEPTHVLDFKKLRFEVPDNLLERAEEAGLEQEDLDLLFDTNKNVNLNSLIRICNASLKLIFISLKKSSLEKIGESVTSVDESVKKQQAKLEDMRHFMDNLLSLKEKLTVSLEQSSSVQQFLPTISNRFQDGVMPATPTCDFSVENSFKSNDFETPNVPPIFASKRMEELKIKLDDTPTTPNVEITNKDLAIDLKCSIITPVSEIRRPKSRVDTPPSTSTRWSRRTSSLSSVHSTPKGGHHIYSYDATSGNIKGLRSSTPNQECFNLSSELLNSPLVVKEIEKKINDSYGVIPKVKFGISTANVSYPSYEIAMDSIAEATEFESLGILELDSVRDDVDFL